jgi:hypothetical protein
MSTMFAFQFDRCAVAFATRATRAGQGAGPGGRNGKATGPVLSHPGGSGKDGGRLLLSSSVCHGADALAMAMPAASQLATRDFFSIQTTGGFAAFEEH